MTRVLVVAEHQNGKLNASTAKSKPLETIAFTDLGVDDDAGLRATRYAAPVRRSKGVMVKDAAGLVDALKQKGLI